MSQNLGQNIVYCIPLREKLLLTAIFFLNFDFSTIVGDFNEL